MVNTFDNILGKHVTPHSPGRPSKKIKIIIALMVYDPDTKLLQIYIGTIQQWSSRRNEYNK